jgi:3-methyladenine DNA glycosylase AlkC
MAKRLKDQYFTAASLDTLAAAISAVYAPFDRGRFLALVHDAAWEERALLAKMRHVTTCLRATLPASYAAALDVLQAAAPAIAGFETMALPEFVAMYGQEEWEHSLPALRFFTRFGSSEFAIRPFLVADPARALAYLHAWAQDEDEHVRRLASEGCRPRLPWAIDLPAFKEDPAPLLPILEQLKADPSLYVRRSVANNLNDIAKDHPDWVLDVCTRWYGQHPDTDWVVKHACRTLLKAGNPRAMHLFGFGETADLQVEALALEREQLSIGDELTFSFTLVVATATPVRVRLAYKVAYVKANGKHSTKVFHIGEGEYPPGRHELARKRSFANLSTRTHYPGVHRLAIIVNGMEKASAVFVLEH